MSEDGQTQPRGAWKSIAALIVAVTIIGGATGWALATIFRPAASAVVSAPYTEVVVSQGTVQSSISLNTVAEWKPSLVGRNQASGTVTSVDFVNGSIAQSGSRLYSVNLRAVSVAMGSVPSFRSLSRGTVGPDVEQLQEMLRGMGLLSIAPDGKYGAATVTAVKKWQARTGTPADGAIQLGDVIFVPTLPSRLVVDPTIVTRGVSLGGGEAAVLALPDEPTFTIPVTQDQAGLIPVKTRVEINEGKVVWEASVVGQSKDTATASVKIALTGLKNGSICGSDCDSVPISGQSIFSSKIVTIEPKKGLVVPSSAVFTDASGRTMVLDHLGRSVSVVVLASANGESVVTGVKEGQKVRVPAGPSQ